MRNYRHMMEQVALSDRKKEEIMEQLELKGTQKRRMPKVRTMILAAALAVGCLLSIAAAAGLPARVYRFIGGGSAVINPGTDTMIYDRMDMASAPAEVDEAGRLWLTVDDRRIDITDQISEETPYIYERTDPESGQKGYLVLGGTPDNLGWIEWFQVDGSWFFHAENCLAGQSDFFFVGAVGGDGDGTFTVEVDNAEGPHGTDPEASETDGGASNPVDITYRPWAEAAKARLAELGVMADASQTD